MVDILIALYTLYMFYRCIRVIQNLTGSFADLNIAILTERFITGRNAGVVTLIDALIRGTAITITTVIDAPFLTAAFIIHTCIVGAGITTACQRHYARS